MKKATIFINNEIAGVYGKYPKQTEEDFLTQVKRTEAACIREAYRETNNVKSYVKIEEI